MPFIPAGFPNLQTTRALIETLGEAGASMIEIGFPFSDPIADGPVIQQAFSSALASGLKVDDIFKTIGEANRRSKTPIPLLAMVSYSIVYRHGLDRFLSQCREAGVDGLILPDLPPPEATEICRRIHTAGLDTVLLIAPSTGEARRGEIARLSSGFIYYLSVTGITGERSRLPADLEANLKALREQTDRPLCVGFGIHRPEHLVQLAPVADGAIVGSAIVRRMTERTDQPPEAIAADIDEYCRSLLGADA